MHESLVILYFSLSKYTHTDIYIYSHWSVLSSSKVREYLVALTVEFAIPSSAEHTVISSKYLPVYIVL